MVLVLTVELSATNASGLENAPGRSKKFAPTKTTPPQSIIGAKTITLSVRWPTQLAL
jgi:hypothetical protein